MSKGTRANSSTGADASHPKPVEFYDEPVVYDVIHTPRTAHEVDGLERIAARFVRPRTREAESWFEPGFGSGRYLRVAASRGRRVGGIDLNPAMVAYARERVERLGLEATLVEGDMTDFAPADVKASGGKGWKGWSFAFNLINTVRHLETDEAMLAHLASMASVLREGGVYALGVSLEDPGVVFPSEDVWEARRGSLHVKQVVQYLPPDANIAGRERGERVISHFTITRPGGVEEMVSSYVLRTYDVWQWMALIDDSAMRLDSVVDEFGEDVDPRGGYGVYILRPA